MNLTYSEKVLKHFRHPKNMGEIKNPDGVATVGNPVCGDIMKLYIKVKNKKIKDIKFQTLGCAAAISISSVLTTMVKGKSLKQAQQIKNEQIIKSLGGLPTTKIHCSLLAVKVLKKAIKNYEKKN